MDGAVWVLPAFMGGGIGRRLFATRSGSCMTGPPARIVGIESEPNAKPFYLRMGARRVRDITRNWRDLRRTLPYPQFAIPGAT